MIDTDKYEGHTRGPWKWPKEDSILLKGKGRNSYIITGRHLDGGYPIDDEADAQLIADAPLLLAEVLRLREGIKQMADTWLDSSGMDSREKLIKMTNQMRELVE